MIDLNKPRMTEKGNKYELLFGYEPLYARLQELENAIESGELAPVVRGKWEVDECDSLDDVTGYSWIDFHCSKCNMDYGLEEGEYSWCQGEKIPYHFCPNCGAKMDLEGEK